MTLQRWSFVSHAARIGRQTVIIKNNLGFHSRADENSGDGHTGFVTQDGAWQSACTCHDRQINQIELDHTGTRSGVDERCNWCFVYLSPPLPLSGQFADKQQTILLVKVLCKSWRRPGRSTLDLYCIIITVQQPSRALQQVDLGASLISRCRSSDWQRSVSTAAELEKQSANPSIDGFETIWLTVILSATKLRNAT